jgi:hypothetical protein
MEPRRSSTARVAASVPFRTACSARSRTSRTWPRT